jgi:hypothetical protein
MYYISMELRWITGVPPRRGVRPVITILEAVNPRENMQEGRCRDVRQGAH